MMHIGDRKPKVCLYGRNRVVRIVILVSYCVQIAKCRVLENFQGLRVRGRGQGLVNWSSRTRTFVEYNNSGITALGVTAINVAYNKPASQSSTYSTATASKANDNKLDTVSCTNMASLTPWWSVDLGTKMDVGLVEVTNDANANYCKMYHTSFCIYSMTDTG